MPRLLYSLALLFLLAGCSAWSSARDAWRWDPTAPQERTRLVLSPEQLAAGTSRLAELQIRRNEIRTRIGTEPDARARQALYAELHAVGRQLSPLERQLAGAAPAP